MIVEPKVAILSYTKDLLETVTAAINQCYSPKTGKELKESLSKEKQQRLLDIVLSSGHLSTIEHASFTFSISGVSRVTETQLVRHRIASYSIKSGRYNKTHTDFIIPPVIANNPKAQSIVEEYKKNLQKTIDNFTELGFKPEDMRFFTPQGTRTNIVVTMNARSLLNFFEHRLCVRAQWEIRKLAQLMLDVVMEVAPEIFKYAGPTCETQKICWEGKMSCGKYKAIKGGELRSRQVD